MKNIYIIISGMICCLVFATSCGDSKTISGQPLEKKHSIQIKGSDTIVNLVQVWAEEFSKIHSDVNIGLTGGGSGTGFAALLNGTCDIAMSSRMIEEGELKQAKERNIKPVEFIVGLDGLIVVSHPSNPVSNLTIDQIRDIFIGNISNWKDLGGFDKKIVILSRESNSGTHMFFKEHVLRRENKKGKEEFSPKSLLMPSSQAIVNEIVQNPHTVGYFGLGYLSPELKAFAIAKNNKVEPVSPSIINVMNNSYPISRPLFLYTNNEPSGAVKEFIEYALSKEGQEIVKRLDFVPIKK